MDTLSIIFLVLALISVILALIPLIISFRKNRKEYKKADKNLEIDITGNWYSAELDLKQNQAENAIHEIEIKRGKSGNEIQIVTKEQLNNLKIKTAWVATGKVITTNTLSLTWEGQIKDSTRYGNVFMQFIENGRGVGYWTGYASNKAWQPVYGYWILSREKDDLEELAKLALAKFVFVDIKDLIENKTNIKNKVLDCSHTWLSEWKTNYDSKGSDWIREKIYIEEKGQKILIKNVETDEDYEYQAQCEVYENNYIFGTWNSLKSPISKGLMSLIVSTQSDYCYGYHFGKNLNGKQEIGPWIIAKNEEALLKARRSIKDPNYHFRSDASINNYKKILHMYHSTKSNGEDIWKYQIIDFTKSNDEEILIAHMEVKDKANQTVIYQINAGQISSHFIMIIKRINGTEEPAVCIIPFMCKINNPENSGLMFGENWDALPQLFKIVISEKPFKEIKSKSKLSSSECEFIESKWKSNFILKDFL